MDLWLIERPPGDAARDEASAFVVAAPDESVARTVACHWCGDEGTQAWLDDRISTATRIGVATSVWTEPAVVLRDFNAG